MNHTEIITAMALGYTTCMIWADFDHDDNAEADQADQTSIKTDKAILEYCAAFYNDNPILMNEWANTTHSWERMGHDLYLTSRCHGTGFWDRGLGELGDQLTDACQIDIGPEFYAHEGLVHV